MSNTTLSDGEKSQKRPQDAIRNYTYNKRSFVSAIWPPERVELLKQLYLTMTHKEIAEALGTTRGSVDSMVTRLKLKKSRPKREPVDDDKRCRMVRCTDNIQSHTWPYCPSCMKKARGK